MEDTGISLLTVVFGVAVVVVTVVAMRKFAHRNTVVARQREALTWQDGATVKPGLFANFGSVLENTLSFSLPPAWNMAWRCRASGLVVLDHSRLIRIAKS